MFQTSAELRRAMRRRAVDRPCPGRGPTDRAGPRDGPLPVVLAGALHVAPSIGCRPAVTLYCLDFEPPYHVAAPPRVDLPAMAQQLAGLDLRVLWLTRAACEDLLARFAEFRGLIFRATSAHLVALRGAATPALQWKGPLQ
ncbi:hypothetical protein ILP92_13085 [Maribius pontilimi]|uniref:Uncharacterized protein n=1 Tax=Palleronia pontilimi TaxID=1964209 RepID=A0A934IJG9_9RHOB|nr:hypothetical protein [Palleronia pontilimi]MBJ3763685.1 hypothetical protein [Palleronia pontilimi]